MANLTISQALRRVKKLKGQMAELQLRASGAASYRETSPPAFEFGSSVEQMGLVRSELISLHSLIAIANARTQIDYNGKPMSLVEAIKTLEDFKSHIAWLRTLPVRAQELSQDTELEHAAGGGYVKVAHNVKCQLPEAKRSELVQSLQDNFDRLNELVESTNHITLI